MIGTIDIEIQAANPQMPLYPVRAFKNSPSSIRLRNVPKRIGNWNINSVQIVAAYPDSSIKTANCVLTGGIWVGTIEGSSISGRSENGLTVFASGIDENGNPVSNYVLGKGLIEILEGDGTITPDAPSYYVHLLDSPPTTPKEGDMWLDSEGGYVIYQNGRPHGLAENVMELAHEAYSVAVEAKTGVVDIQDMIPSQASLSNQLADKAFVNSSVQTATANFRGNWATWMDVPSDASEYPLDYAGSRTPTVNDYMVVQDASGYVAQGGSAETYEGTWRFKYSGVWSESEKFGWLPEYQVNETPMTAAQLAAINSNITAAKVAEYDEAMTKFDYVMHYPTPQTMTLNENIFPITYTDNDTTYTVQLSDLGTTLSIDYVNDWSGTIIIKHNNGTTNPVLCTVAKKNGEYNGGVSNYYHVTLNGTTMAIGDVIFNTSGGLVMKNRAINLIELDQTFNNPSLVFPTLTAPNLPDFIIHVSSSGTRGYTYQPALTFPSVTYYGNDTGEKPSFQKPTSNYDTKRDLVYVSCIRNAGTGYWLLKGMNLQGVSMS